MGRFFLQLPGECEMFMTRLLRSLDAEGPVWSALLVLMTVNTPDHAPGLSPGGLCGGCAGV